MEQSIWTAPTIFSRWEQKLWLAISLIVGAGILLVVLTGTQTTTSSSMFPIRIVFEDYVLLSAAQEVAAKEVIIMGEEALLVPDSTSVPEDSQEDQKIPLQASSTSECFSAPAKVSAYNSLSNQTDDDPWSGAYGTVGPGSIAADPRMIRPYSRIFVPGYGWGSVRDTGSAVIASGSAGLYHVDVWMETYGQAITWGIRWLDIQICRPERL